MSKESAASAATTQPQVDTGNKPPKAVDGGVRPPPAPTSGTGTGSSIILLEPSSSSSSQHKPPVAGLEYRSPLEHLRGGEEGPRLDPNTTLCRFQLDGECRDAQCEYQHLRPQ